MKHISEYSDMRKIYLVRFLFRVCVLITVLILYFRDDDVFGLLEPGGFFRKFSPFHLLWLLWMADMITKLIPSRVFLCMGSEKQYGKYCRPAKHPASKRELEKYRSENDRRSLVVFAVWAALGLLIAYLWQIGILGRKELFIISIVFYVCDLICVLFWCPFRVFFLHNRCCTTCRIFNWDHFMMATPLICMNSFYSWSLLGMSIVILGLWEYRAYRYPERFYEGTNEALQCRYCTDRLCGRRRQENS